MLFGTLNAETSQKHHRRQVSARGVLRRRSHRCGCFDAAVEEEQALSVPSGKECAGMVKADCREGVGVWVEAVLPHKAVTHTRLAVSAAWSHKVMTQRSEHPVACQCLST